MPKYQFVPIATDGRRGEPVAVAAYDDAVAMRRALILPGAGAWDIWCGVKHVGLVAAPAQAASVTHIGHVQRAASPPPAPAQAA